MIPVGVVGVHTRRKITKKMSERIESARATFRKLAVFEVDAKKSLVANSDWGKTKHLLAAADVVDELFWRQASPDIDYRSLLDQMGDDEELREMFLFNRGPYDRFNRNEPFLPVEPEFVGGGFYPRDLTREEFLEHIRKHRELELSFESPYTLISRTNSHLTAVPYHVAYRELVEQLSGLLAEASRVEPHHGFREFLAQRAKDLLVDDYSASETLWVSLEDNPIDLVVGPYEVYEDGLMGLKASYEAIMFERDLEESTKILHIQRELLPLCKKVERELGRPLNVQDAQVRLSVANLIYAGGEARKAVPAIAFSLPNDERVIEEVGSRQVILKNVIEAKFVLVAHKIANRLLEEPLDDEQTAFRGFLNHTLFHEISHSLGPQRILVNGDATTVNRCLKQYHSVLEEAKADALGACLALNADEDLDAGLFLKGYVGHFIRSIRFGLDQAHGGANAIQFNYLLMQESLVINQETGRLSVDESRARAAVFRLAATIMDIQERGDFAAAQNFVNRFGVSSPEIEELIKKVDDFPIDIRIRYLNWDS
jgi:hypothetical protein